ncbi:MAG TPA: aldo/keto reductase [Thermodesulfobacteriota bacterium]
MSPTRRDLVRAGAAIAASALLPPLRAAPAEPALIERRIPSSGESLPVVGIGTARRYDVSATAEERAELTEVLRRFAASGGRLIDTAPSYGSAESVVGDLVSALGLRERLFLATKVGATGREAGIAQLETSMRRLRTTTLDLVAVHNLQDTATQLATLREWKQRGRIRYVGITTSFDRQYAEFERTMRAETLDMVQVDYALDNRGAGERILPLAADRGMGVMVNLPFGRGRLFRAVEGKALPEWAREFDCESWAQFFLKYVIAHPAVTCVIPGTARVRYLADNLGAARGRLPTAAMRRRMEQFIDGL